MGWETRGNKRFYYRKVRVGNRVRSAYCGSGARGELAAMEDQQRRSTTPVPASVSIPAHHSFVPSAKRSWDEILNRYPWRRTKPEPARRYRPPSVAQAKKG